MTGVRDRVRILPLGDMALIVEFGDEISLEVNEAVRALAASLEARPVPGVEELVPTYRSLTIHYHSQAVPWNELKAELERRVTRFDTAAPPVSHVAEIPVLYGGEAGPDLPFVARHCSLTATEVVRLHTGVEYRVYMLGFAPGFPYLGGMDPNIAAPRLKTPRVRIAAGSVGIAGKQTGIYPTESPGGWQLIGRTPVRLYDPHRERPILLEPGWYIRFRAMGHEEYREIKAREAAGEYRCKITAKEMNHGLPG